jgi:CheY-like chemotaxis protein
MLNGDPENDEPTGSAEPSSRQLRVLVVDDNELNLRIAAAFLKKLGHSVEQAMDGYMAVEAARVEIFDAILMDCHMPLMDGYESTRQIRRLGHPHGSVPIIAMTAADGATKAICLAAGMNDFMSKPVTRGQLANLLSRWCRA